MEYSLRNEAGYWSIYAGEHRLVDRESFAVADRIYQRLLNPKLDDFSEATDVARSIRDWARRNVGTSA